MKENSADKKMLTKSLKQLVGILSPRLKQLWDLYENIGTWKDEKEKEKIQRFLQATEKLVCFLNEAANGSFGLAQIIEPCDTSKPGLYMANDRGLAVAFPARLTEAFSDKVTAVVQAGQDIDWEKKPIEEADVRALYEKMRDSMSVVRVADPRECSGNQQSDASAEDS